MNYEVLAPAGELKAILPLIDAGANAIYVGLKGHSSRPARADLTLKEIENAVELCHANGARLHVAINGGIANDDFSEVKRSLSTLEKYGVDAVIISDWGMLKQASQLLNTTELHASTLLGVYNVETVRILKNMGVTRVVLSTNLFIDEIIAIMSGVPDMEYEIVADGGICYNDNRICELSHYVKESEYRVGCREAYYLNAESNTKVSIGSKAISLSEIIQAFAELGIISYKIEGRTIHYQDIIPHTRKLSEALKNTDIQKNVSALHYFKRTNMGDYP